MHMFGFVSNSSPRALASHRRIGIDQIEALNVTRTRRMNRATNVFGTTEEVLLLRIWWAGRVVAFENRFEESVAQGESLERAVAEYSLGRQRPFAPVSMAGELERVAGLVRQGVITPAEWEQMKANYIGASPNKIRRTRLWLLFSVYTLSTKKAFSRSTSSTERS